MDNAVARAQAYLHVNVYFTVTEYPVIESMCSHGYQIATDLDVLAFRFPGAGRLVPGKRKLCYLLLTLSLFVLRIDCADMLICEVKEGQAKLNRNARNPRVLKVMLARFGCCPMMASDEIIEQLQQKGRAVMTAGHQVRMVALGKFTSCSD